MLNKKNKFVKTKPWQTKEWQAMRDQKIGDVCEQCGSSKPPMVLQHLVHPDNFDVIRKRVVSEKFQAYLKANEITIPKKVTILRHCPSCRYRSLSKRTTMTPVWRCIRCHHQFDNPLETTESKIDFEAQKKFFKEFISGDGVNNCIDEAAKQVYAEYQKEYMSGENTVTFCKKCAFLWDVKYVRLCGQCKKHYTKRSSKTLHCKDEICWRCRRGLASDTPRSMPLEQKQNAQKYLDIVDMTLATVIICMLCEDTYELGKACVMAYDDRVVCRNKKCSGGLGDFMTGRKTKL